MLKVTGSSSQNQHNSKSAVWVVPQRRSMRKITLAQNVENRLVCILMRRLKRQVLFRNILLHEWAIF